MVASMKYGITIATIGDWPFIAITQQEFQQIKDAKMKLLAVIEVEEKFDLFQSAWAPPAGQARSTRRWGKDDSTESNPRGWRKARGAHQRPPTRVECRRLPEATTLLAILRQGRCPAQGCSWRC